MTPSSTPKRVVLGEGYFFTSEGQVQYCSIGIASDIHRQYEIGLENIDKLPNYIRLIAEILPQPKRKERGRR